MTSRAIAVIGAGQAGIAAASTAAAHGIHVHLFDRFAIDLLDSPASLTTYPGTSVWGVFPGWQIGATRDDEAITVQVDAILLANGPIDEMVTFAGATRPGVMTASGLAQLTDRWRLLPGRRFVIIGEGPIAQDCVDRVQRDGGEIILQVPASLAISLEVLGDPAVTGVLVDGAHLDADTVVMAAGVVPDLSLAAMAGCDLVFDENVQDWRLLLDAGQRTSLPSVWAAGGVAGHFTDAAESGRRAAEDMVAALTGGLQERYSPVNAASLTTIRQPWQYDQRIGAENAR